MSVAIVGAGITGLSSAWHLARRGLGPVTVYERDGVGAGASGVQPGGVRQQWGTRLNCLLARESLAFYRRLPELLEPRVDPRFRACGYAFVAETEETLARLGDEVALQNELGIPSRLVPPDEAAELVPGLVTDTVVGASWCAEDGYFDRPQGVVEAFAEAVRRDGTEIVRAEVTALEPDGAGWRLRFADGDAATADAVVVAAAERSRPLLATAGVDVPIEAEDRFLFYSEPVRERLLEPLVIAPDRRFAAKQLGDGRLLMSDLSAAGDEAAGRDRWRAAIRKGVDELLPHLTYVDLPLLVRGVYDMTPDRTALVGPAGPDGLFVAAGSSGHGFMTAPAVGAGVARLVAGEDAGELIAQLSPARLARAELQVERQVI